jgi:hypothetical protein
MDVMTSIKQHIAIDIKYIHIYICRDTIEIDICIYIYYDRYRRIKDRRTELNHH